MSYQVLARKWRPSNFQQLVGQDHVQIALSNALEQQRLHHAYLFTGTRGVGKTTIARILAKCLNCEEGIRAEPCGKCRSCLDMAEGRFIDLIEVDAASRTKVEDTRELLENVQYAPTQGRFKVYLIDEVHMLSKHSFNALLKTLEEPPSHVKFLFATTDPQKVPATVLSRCLQFNLKRMSIDTIQKHLNFLLQEESVESNQTALKQIAQAADGSMRDALSLLDQAIVYGAGKVEENTVREMLGGVAHEPLLVVLEAVINASGEQVLEAVKALSSATPDYEIAADTLIHLLHQLSIMQLVPSVEREDDELSHLAQCISPEDIQLYYQIALYGRRDLPLSPDPRMGFEMIVLRMLAFRPVDMQQVSDLPQNTKKKLTQNETDYSNQPIVDNVIQAKTISEPIIENTAQSEIISEPIIVEHIAQTKTVSDPILKDIHPTNRISEPVQKNTEQSQTSVETSFDTQSQTTQIQSTVIKRPQTIQTKSTVSTPLKEHDDWHRILPQLNLAGMTAAFARDCLFDQPKESHIQLYASRDVERLLNDITESELQSELENFFAKSIKLNISFELSLKQRQCLETPAQKIIRDAKERQSAAEQAIYADPFVQQLQQRFNAEILVNSIQAIAVAS
jgi:DNA polymerase-3 subunit gamma/tau